MRSNKTLALAAPLSCALLMTGAASAADVTYERLLNPEPHNWLMVHRDFAAQRFSPLAAINRSNIKDMKLKFAIAATIAATCTAADRTAGVRISMLAGVRSNIERYSPVVTGAVQLSGQAL